MYIEIKEFEKQNRMTWLKFCRTSISPLRKKKKNTAN